jgi:hypothetical protein
MLTIIVMHTCMLHVKYKLVILNYLVTFMQFTYQNLLGYGLYAEY